MDEQAIQNSDDTGTFNVADSSVLTGDGETPNKTGRNEDGTFAKGNPGGPGRPKGMSMKEFARQRFKWMDYDEKKAFIDALPPDIVWRMAEGNPSTDTKQEVSGSLTIEISEKIANKNKLYDPDSSPE